MVLFDCGGYTFNNGIDSGNLGRVELVKKHSDEIFNPAADPLNCDQQPQGPNNSHHHHHQLHPTVNVEVNVWTRPDCAGTAYENGNRTWFHFGVKGGQSSHILRINVMNLNRQAKLYSQGMHPVVKIGASGKWERVKDRPSYRTDDENFVMSFVHRAGLDPSVEHFYAFTFPYSYKELQEYLSRLDRRFRKRMFEVQKKSIEENICLFVDQADLEGMTTGSQNESETGSSSSCSNPGSPTGSTLSLLIRRDSGSDSSNSPELVTAEDLYNEIYYCRELLTYSVEKRRIDLVTITSYHGISAEREERLPGLFPENIRHRCHTFKGKKVIFLSSRVHPGETPASFVLNGFLKLLLDRKSQIAATLRKMYVFKIVPFLNPDGVANGMYRSDTLGHNLNRVYTDPDPKTQPSIYAVRRLLRFYQFGHENEPTLLPAVEGAEESLPRKEEFEGQEPEDELENPESGEITQNQVISLKELIKNQLNREEAVKDSPSMSSTETATEDTSPESKSSSTATEIPVPKDTSLKQGKKEERSKGIPSRIHHKISTTKKEFKRKASPKATIMSARYKGAGGGVPAATDEEDSPVGHLSNAIDFHNLYNQFESVETEKHEDKTNLFLYVDMHGHASKKGVFMYGNHLAHPMQAVECMLLPRLMSLNSHHFHFDACNFSERNMYHKGKRDGLSKEGSGRVAVYKATGIIKCYTLECNYNTGKYVNVLPARGKDKAPKAVNLVPPKYTPTVFEEVGRAMGASILDLTNSNPLSRLGNSEFRTLQGLRNALRLDIEKTFTKNQLLMKAAKGKLKRLKGVLCSETDVFKENRSHWTTVSTVATVAGTSNRQRIGGLGASKAIPSSSKSTVSQSGSSTLYGKKERPTTVRKKGKLLLDPRGRKEGPLTGGLGIPPIPLLNLVPVKRLKAAAVSGESDEVLSSAAPSTSSSDESRPSTTNTASDSHSEGSSVSMKSIPRRASGIPVLKRPSPLVTIASVVSGVNSVSYTGASTSRDRPSVPSKISTIRGAGSVVAMGLRKPLEAGEGGSKVRDGAKIKNKRPSLKGDALTVVKRKKSRAKSVWH